MRPLIVKLGGSLARSPGLGRWLRLIALRGAGRVVLVPGGGPFADTVREVQSNSGFDDHTAHRMALLAMEQYGIMLCGLQTGLVTAGSTATIGSALERTQVPVWMPSAMVLADVSIPSGWGVTSDSLSAWLANHLDASMLVVVKSLRSPEPLSPVGELVANGWVDRCFGGFMAGARFQLRLLGVDDQSILERILLPG